MFMIKRASARNVQIFMNKKILCKLFFSKDTNLGLLLFISFYMDHMVKGNKKRKLTSGQVCVMNSTMSYDMSPWTSICSFSVGPWHQLSKLKSIKKIFNKGNLTRTTKSTGP